MKPVRLLIHRGTRARHWQSFESHLSPGFENLVCRPGKVEFLYGFEQIILWTSRIGLTSVLLREEDVLRNNGRQQVLLEPPKRAMIPLGHPERLHRAWTEAHQFH